MKDAKTSPAEKPAVAQRVAAFLLSLEKPAAAALLKSLEPAFVAEVAAAMTDLDESFSDERAVDAVYVELARLLHRPSGPRAADKNELSALLESAIGRERAKAVILEIEERRRVERPFAALEDGPPAALATVLGGESPAVAALVLAHFDPERSAAVLSALEPDRALDVVRRMATLAPPGFEALSSVARSLETRVAEVAKQPPPADPKVRLKSIAKLLTFSEQTIEKAVLEGLDASDQAMAQEIREFMFTWTDLAGVDKRGMQKILSSVETRTLAIALKACPPDVEKNVLDNLSVRVRAMVADERELAGPMPIAEVEAARAEIMRSVRALMDAGDFKPSRGGEELVK